MKKRQYHILFIVISALVFFGCDDYLDHYLKDQISLEEAFQKRSTTESYLANVYSYLKRDYDPMASNTAATTSRSDEAYYSWTTYVEYLDYNNGSWTPSSNAYHTWTHYYNGIKQATIFMENVGNCPDTEISKGDKAIMKAECRFLRAYYYFMLMQQYGPVFVWGDKMPDENIDPATVDRHPLDSCINFISSELDKAAEVLPVKITDEGWYGRATKGAALATKSRMWLYAARPLFNGNDWYKGMTNLYGDFLFPQTPDPNKWDSALVAAKAVIELKNTDGVLIYELVGSRLSTPTFGQHCDAYAEIYKTKWNSELIFARWESEGASWNRRVLPPNAGLSNAYGGYAATLKLADTYPMQSTGRFPILGYERDGAPIVDGASGYVEDGFTTGYRHPYDGGDPIKAHNSYVGRDARFYVSIFCSGMYWIQGGSKYKKVITFHSTGTSSYANPSGDFVKTGYLFRRMTDKALDTQSGNWGNFSWPYFRLGEIYLNYAEAWIMMDASHRASSPSGLEYWNKIRKRVGLINIDVAYPELFGNIDANRMQIIDILLKERMVELAFENQRYYDIRMWKLGERESNGKRYGRNLLANNYEDSWQRTDQICLPIVCERKHHLFPIHQNQLNEMKNMTQNYGW